MGLPDRAAPNDRSSAIPDLPCAPQVGLAQAGRGLAVIVSQTPESPIHQSRRGRPSADVRHLARPRARSLGGTRCRVTTAIRAVGWSRARADTGRAARRPWGRAEADDGIGSAHVPGSHTGPSAATAMSLAEVRARSGAAVCPDEGAAAVAPDAIPGREPDTVVRRHCHRLEVGQLGDRRPDAIAVALQGEARVGARLVGGGPGPRRLRRRPGPGPTCPPDLARGAKRPVTSSTRTAPTSVPQRRDGPVGRRLHGQVLCPRGARRRDGTARQRAPSWRARRRRWHTHAAPSAANATSYTSVPGRLPGWGVWDQLVPS